MKWLKARWDELWAASGAKPSDSLTSESVFQDIINRYKERQRMYHTVKHINQCLTDAKDARREMEDWRAVEFALWFHDAIYIPQNHDNEEASARLAESVLGEIGVEAENVVELILATAHNVRLPIKSDADYVVDIDLGILGRPPHEFDVYEEQIRREYQWVPWQTYCTERCRILRQFYDRDRIYRSFYFRQRYEDQARSNLQRSIRRLS